MTLMIAQCFNLLIQAQGVSDTNFHVEVEDEVDSDSSKNGKRSYNLMSNSATAPTSSSGQQGGPERISSRRRTNTSDDVDVETTGVSSEKSSDRDDVVDNLGKVSFFAPLIKVAASMNPQQFELPPELVEPIPFPGTFLS